MDFTFIILIWFIVMGGIGFLIGKSRGRPMAGIVWGLVLGPIGWLLVGISGVSSNLKDPRARRMAKQQLVERSFSQKAAKASWIAPPVILLIFFQMTTALNPSTNPRGSAIASATLVFILLTCAILGVIGCLGVRNHDWKTTLLPGLTGIVLSATLLLVLLMPAD